MGCCCSSSGVWKGEKAYLRTMGHLQQLTLLPGTHPLLQRLPEQHLPHPTLHAYHKPPAGPGAQCSQKCPLKPCLPALLPTEHLNRGFCQLPQAEATRSSRCTCPTLLAFHCANSPPPPHLMLWIQPGCSASSSGCPGVRSWLGQELWRQAWAQGRSQQTPAAWTQALSLQWCWELHLQGNSKRSGPTTGCDKQTLSRASQQAGKLHLHPTALGNLTQHHKARNLLSWKASRAPPDQRQDWLRSFLGPCWPARPGLVPTPPHSQPILTSLILQDTVEPLQHCLLLCVQVL